MSVPPVPLLARVSALLALTSPLLLAAPKPPPPRVPTRMEKLVRVLALEDSRSAGGGELDRLLRDPDRGVRRRAALAAGRVGDPALVPALVDLMNDQEPLIRQMAAFALGLVGDASAVERLAASLADSDPVVRGRSAEALGRIGDTRAGPELARFVLATMPKGAPIVAVRGDDPGSVNDPWVELRLALVSLGRLKDVRSVELALLDKEKPRFDWWAATWVAMRLESPSLKPVLLAAAASNDPLSRALAVRGLGALKDPAAVEVVAPLVRDKSEAVVVSALRALGAIGDARGVAAAASALDSQSSAVQREALRALAVLPADRSLRPRIVPFVGSREPWIRAAALAALARSDRESFALVLSGLDPDPVWFVRSSLATTLGDVGDETSLSLLFGLLKDEDARVLPAVLEALQKARGADSVDTLTRHLEHPDFAVRAAAAAGLAAQKAGGVVPMLAAAYRRGLLDVDLDARLAAVDALGAQADAPAKETLREAARSDPSRVVRERASRALSTLGETNLPRPGPDAERPPVDYRLTLLPYDPLPGVPLFSPRAFVYTRHGKIEILLDVLETPLTTASFIDLAHRGFYDGLTFHRVEPNFVVQGGCPRGDGNGGPGYTLRSELTGRPYGRGAVGMALSGKDTAGSQFFVTLSPQPHLDGDYPLFGTVVAGMEHVDRIRPGDVIERVEIWTGP
jgi:cyclophilin family peptidyl-prolyl cis-trans isomerase